MSDAFMTGILWWAQCGSCCFDGHISAAYMAYDRMVMAMVNGSNGTTAKLSYYNKKNINTIYSMYHLLQPWSNAQMVIISGSQNKNNPPWSQNIIKVINKSLDTYGSTGYHHGWQTQLSNQLYTSHTYEAPMPASYSLHEKPRLWLKVL